MADINKLKLQLRLSLNGDKTPSPATKLLINHGKPNFTIQRSTKAHNGNVKPTSPTPAVTFNVNGNNNNNNNYNSNDFVVKSTTFNGVFKPSNISAATKKSLPQNGHVNNNGTDNEAAKVVLRRATVGQTQTELRQGEEDENVPEFIRRQRRIQQRLANQNILDFENRRSGYFTQVLISPSSPNRKSFVETMASPAIKPGLEIPPPTTTQHERIREETTLEEQQHEQKQQTEVENNKESTTAELVDLNSQVEEEEVAKAIEEVNKAVEGEDDDKTELEDFAKISQQQAGQNISATVVAATTLQHVEALKQDKNEKQNEENHSAEEPPVVKLNITDATDITQEQTLQENDHTGASVSTQEATEDLTSNCCVEVEILENGSLKTDRLDNGITISHANGLNGPSIPPADPSGEKGVNFETKTVVSFSQELGNEDNKYPDKVRVLTDVETMDADGELNDLKKLKFEINPHNQDIEVKTVLVTETA